MLHADDLLRRNIGGTRGGGNATNRDAELLVLDEQELDASISRTENWMCSQVLFSGKVQCRDGDTGEIVAEIDYGPISRTVTAKPWSDPTADPLADLKTAQRLVSGACGFAANFIVMGRLAGDAFEANTKVLGELQQASHSTRRSCTAEFEQFGVVLLGTWRGIPLYVSEEQYEDTDGTMKYFVPEEGSLSRGKRDSERDGLRRRGPSLRRWQRDASLRRAPDSAHLLGSLRRRLPPHEA